jgi:prepilin-type N-terminal cleavage/methylation domain-containing protein
MRRTFRKSHRRGFLLLEVILALMVFGIAATGFAVALNHMGKAAHNAQQELRITRILESALDEAMSLPTLEEGSSTVVVPDTDIEIDTTVELLKEIENQDGQLLQEMYRVFGRMYQP